MVRSRSPVQIRTTAPGNWFQTTTFKSALCRGPFVFFGCLIKLNCVFAWLSAGSGGLLFSATKLSMKTYLQHKFALYVRNAEVGRLMEIFLVAAVASLLVIRAYLKLTGYPQIGGGRFHVAHMLFGGLIMLLAIILMLTFLSRQSKILGALLGGVGFGTFIDELGKFITRDNNYFYQPAVALIYVIFIFIFLWLKMGDRYLTISPEGYAVNALEVMKEMLTKDMDETEKHKAIALLRQSDNSDPLVLDLLRVLEKMPAAPAREPHMAQKIKSWAKSCYLKILNNDQFVNAIVLFAVGLAVAGFLEAMAFLDLKRGFASWGEVISSAAAVCLVFSAARLLYLRKRLAAFKRFNLALLISIFFTQFFIFLREQLSGLISLGIALILYAACQFLINQEESSAAETNQK